MGTSESTETANKTETSTDQPIVEIPKKKMEFKLHIAIDFGTDGCGLAFAYQGKVYPYNKWKTQKKKTAVKTKTHIVLNEKNELFAFGNYAKSMYSNVMGKQRNTLKFFEGFKMALYADNIKHGNVRDVMQDDGDDNENKDNVKICTKEYIKATNGKSLLASIVFVEALKYLHELAKDYLFKITKDDISDQEIQWILTVPAIWSESAKDKMRKWIIEAGLVDDSIIDQCIIVYEPDCASLALQKEYFQDIYDDDGNQVTANPTDDGEYDADSDDIKMQDRFEEGDIYILLDSGGGTVDVACHQVLEDGSVEEIIWPTGGDWGSCYIDHLYIKLLIDIFGKDWIDEYKNKDPTHFVEIKQYFEAAKEAFYSDGKQNETQRVQLPFEFCQYLEEKCGQKDGNCTPEMIVSGYAKSLQYFRKLFKDEDGQCSESKINTKVYGNETFYNEKDLFVVKLISYNDNASYENSEEYLEIDSRIIQCAFDSKIDKIVSHVHGLLNMDALKDKCKYLCLVGGFSGSLYFQKKIKNAFGEKSTYNLKLVIPKKPILTVVQGAAWMGVTKNYIKARKLKHTYGIELYCTTQTAKDRGISNEYIENNLTEHGVDGYFNIVAKKGDRIALNEIKNIVSYRTSITSCIPILYSNKVEPKTINDGEKLATLKVEHIDENKDIITEFHFYDTIFKVFSYPKTNQSGKKMVVIEYVK